MFQINKSCKHLLSLAFGCYWPKICALNTPYTTIGSPFLIVSLHYRFQSIGDRKDNVCLRLYGQKPNSTHAAISAMLDSEGRAFVLMQVLDYNYVIGWITRLEIYRKY